MLANGPCGHWAIFVIAFAAFAWVNGLRKKKYDDTQPK